MRAVFNHIGKFLLIVCLWAKMLFSVHTWGIHSLRFFIFQFLCAAKFTYTQKLYMITLIQN